MPQIVAAIARTRARMKARSRARSSVVSNDRIPPRTHWQENGAENERPAPAGLNSLGLQLCRALPRALCGVWFQFDIEKSPNFKTYVRLYDLIILKNDDSNVSTDTYSRIVTVNDSKTKFFDPRTWEMMTKMWVGAAWICYKIQTLKSFVTNSGRISLSPQPIRSNGGGMAKARYWLGGQRRWNNSARSGSAQPCNISFISTGLRHRFSTGAITQRSSYDCTLSYFLPTFPLVSSSPTLLGRTLMGTQLLILARSWSRWWKAETRNDIMCVS